MISPAHISRVCKGRLRQGTQKLSSDFTRKTDFTRKNVFSKRLAGGISDSTEKPVEFSRHQSHL
jgi:hypothetical protein